MLNTEGAFIAGKVLSSRLTDHDSVRPSGSEEPIRNTTWTALLLQPSLVTASSNVLLVDRVLVVGEALRDHTFQIVIIHINLKDEFLLIAGRDSFEVGTYQFIVEIIR